MKNPDGASKTTKEMMKSEGNHAKFGAQLDMLQAKKCEAGKKSEATKQKEQEVGMLYYIIQ